MGFDFELVLVIGCLITGLGWAIELIWWKPKRLRRLNEAVAAAGGQLPENSPLAEAKEPVLAEYSRSFFPILAVVLIFRSFFFEPYQIPSGSMLPTLKVGDFIIVNKYTYGLRLPVTGTKVLSVNEPQRGDVMVFKFPRDESIKFIKRVIGVPGDRITYINKQLFINDSPVPQEYVGMDNLEKKNQLGIIDYVKVKTMSETLGDTNYQIFNELDFGLKRTFEVPEGSYFMMGDNRDGSNDSRSWGFVDEDLIVGKAVAVWMHWDNFFSLPNFSTAGGIE